MFERMAIKSTLKKVAPDYIPMSLPRCENNDFFAALIKFVDEDELFLIKSEKNSSYYGYLWVDDNEYVEFCLLKESLSKGNFKIEIVHYFKGYVLEYHNPTVFIFSRIIKHHLFVFSQDRVKQVIFNNRKLVVASRMDVLNFMVDKTEENQNFSSSPMHFAMNVYSRRFVSHPNMKKVSRRYKLIFDSLVNSEDLVYENGSYKLTPKAIVTLSDYERDEQKHMDSTDNSRKTRKLTKAIILLGLLNLLLQVVKWIFGDK